MEFPEIPETRIASRSYEQVRDWNRWTTRTIETAGHEVGYLRISSVDLQLCRAFAVDTDPLVPSLVAGNQLPSQLHLQTLDSAQECDPLLIGLLLVPKPELPLIDA